MKKILLITLSILVISGLVFTGGYFILTARDTIAFEDMEYLITEQESQDLIDLIISSTEQVKTAKNFRAIKKTEDALSKATSNYTTKYSVLNIKTYQDTSDDELTKLLETVSDTLNEMSNLLTNYNKAILEGEFKDDYKEWVGDFIYEKIENEITLNSDSAVPLKQQKDRLGIEYNNLIVDISTEHEGVSYTAEDIANSVTDPELYHILINKLYADNADVFSEIYLDMIDFDTQIAQTLGFESAAEMHYLSMERDYTPQDSFEYFDNVKKYIVPLYHQIGDYTGLSSIMPQEMPVTLAAFENSLSQINREMSACFDFVEKYDLMDIEARENKNPLVGFTQTLTEHDAFFVYMSWDDTFSSTSTLIHEFGHAFENYSLFNRNSYSSNIDVAESFSQGLEFLFHEFYDEFIPTEYVEVMQLSNLAGTLVNSIIFQAMLEEFQLTVYSNPDITNDDLAKLYHNLMLDYGIAVDDGQTTHDYSWYRISHLFDAPFYTISYCTSASVALELWALSQDDWDAALDKYMDLIQTDHNQDFLDILEQNEMSNPFTEESFLNIVDMFEQEFDLAEDNAA